MDAKISSSSISRIIIVFAFFVILPFVFLSFFNHPQNDDYVYASWTKHYGFAVANVRWFLVWSGRYLTTAILSASPLVFGWFGAYKIIPALIIGALFGSLYLFIRTIYSDSITRNNKLTLSLAVLALYFTIMPNPAEGIYWMSGAVCYQLGSVLFLVIAGMTCRLLSVGSRNRVRTTLLAAVLIIAAIGTNEVTMLSLLAFLGTLFLYRLTVDRSLNVPAAVLLATAVLGTAVVFLAPGNQARLSLSHPDLAGALQATAVTGSAYLLRWLFLSPLLPVALLWYGNRNSQKPLLPFRVNPLFSIALFLALSYALFFPSFYGTGRVETRTVNVIALFFLVGFFLNCEIVIDHRAAVRGRVVAFSTGSFFVPVAAAMFILAVVGPSVTTAYGDMLSGRAMAYDRELNERYRIIRDCPWMVCEVPPLSSVPKTVYFFENALDDRSESDFFKGYKDSGFAYYFGKARIRLNRPAPYQLMP
jgi:hypothetical protein